MILYEIVYGQVPFGSNAEDPIEIYKEILESSVKYNKKFKDYQGLLQSLLEKSPGLRTDYESLIHSEDLTDIKWDLLINRKIQPSFIPKIPEENYTKFEDFSTILIRAEESNRIINVNNN